MLGIKISDVASAAVSFCLCVLCAIAWIRCITRPVKLIAFRGGSLFPVFITQTTPMVYTPNQLFLRSEKRAAQCLGFSKAKHFAT